MSVELAITLQENAWSLQADGKIEPAAEAYREALSMLDALDESVLPDIANILNDLAELERDRQNLDCALTLSNRARSIEGDLGVRFTGPDATRIRCRTLGLLGMIRCDQGDYSSAEGELERALAESIKEFGECSDDAAEARNNLALLYKHWGYFDKGLELYEAAHAYVISTHGEGSLASAVIYHNIGGILQAQGKFEAAEKPGLRAWQISRQLLGDDDPRAVLDGAAYAAILDGLKRYKESEEIYRHAIGIFEQGLSPRHYEVAVNLHNLAAALAAQGQSGEAEHCYRRSLAMKESQLGPGSPDVALTRNNLGRLLKDVGRSGEALPLLKNAVMILDKRLAPGHPHLTAARNNLRDAIRLSNNVSAKDSELA